jgi:exodeoxyribonuclease VIII
MNKPTLPATADFTRQQYEAIEALSFTGLKELLKSPAHYQQWKATPSEETKALLIGKAVHLAVLKNADFLSTYAMAPECDRRTKEGKAIWQASMDSLAPGQVQLNFDDYNLVLSIADGAFKICQDAGIDCLKQDGWRECALTAKSKETPLKGIPDLISDDGYIYDLKTTSDSAGERSALSTILNFKYHLQAAHYINLAHAHRSDVRGFRVILVEKDAGHQGAIYEIAGDLLERGRKEVERAYSIYDQCSATKQWPSLASAGVTVLADLPGAKKVATEITI